MLDTAQRITRITTPTDSGSGHIIAPRLVLTSAHLVPEAGGRVQVHTATDHRPHTGEVVWRGTPHGHDDAALVHVTDPAWSAPAVTTRWGRLVTHAPATPCQVWGFADLVQRPGRAAETVQLTGTLAPGTHFVNHRHVMELDIHPPGFSPQETARHERAGERPSLWAGLSGAALRCGDGKLLTGVVATDPQYRDHAALEAVPVYVLHHDPAFRAVLAEHGVPLALDPVELAPLAQPPRGQYRRLSPAALLEAGRRVVAFHGRDEAMRTLTAWCGRDNDDDVLSAVVVSGPGGQGKTRLAHELVDRLNDPEHPEHDAAPGRPRWAALWLDGGAGAGELDRVKDATAPLLVVLDYAETRTGQLTRLLQLCERPEGSAPVRLLLLVRTLGEWWEQVDIDTDHLLTDITRHLPLPPLAPRDTERVREYRTALHHLARALPQVRTPHPADWEQVAADLADPDLSGPEWETALSLHMRALADLLDATQPDDPSDGAGGGDTPGPTGPVGPTGPTGGAVTADSAVEARVLAHEYRYWDQSAAAQGLGGAELTQPLRDVLALAFTLPSRSIDEADHLLRDATVLEGQTRALRDRVRRWISGLYPAEEPQLWGYLQPDRLLEYFVGQRLRRNPYLFDPQLDTLTATGLENLVTLYVRAAAHSALPDLAGHLTGLCVRHAEPLGPAAIGVATQAEHPGPLIRALEGVAADPETPTEVLARLNGALPLSSQRLAEVAERLTGHLVQDRREQAERDPETYLPALAGSLNSQSLRLADLGRVEEALEASTEAVRIRRALVEQDPEAHLPGLAGSLNNQSVYLGRLGRTEESLETIDEAFRYYRVRADRYPDANLPGLALALGNRSLRLVALGRAEEGLEASTEAVRISRALAEQAPGAHLPGLATALGNRSGCLNALGRVEEALESETEAARISRALAERDPGVYLSDLAGSLTNRSRLLSALGRAEEALHVVTEAVQHYRVLAEQLPETHLSGLANALANQTNYLDALGRTEERCEVITEVVQHYRTLADQQDPDAHLPDLATALNNRSRVLSALGRAEEALEANTEAVRIRRALAEQDPGAHLPGLAEVLHNQSLRLVALGWVEEALGVIGEAVRHYRALAEQRPKTYLPGLALALTNRFRRLKALGRRGEALEVIGEAVRVRRALVGQEGSGARLSGLAEILHRQSDHLADLGRYEEALGVIGEAVRHYRALAEQDPDAHLPDLVAVLNNRSLRLADLGHFEEALGVVGEAARISRALAEQDPGGRLPVLATVLHNRSLRLRNLGRVEEALDVVTEAIEIRAALARERPDAHQQDLDLSLRIREQLRSLDTDQG